MTQLTECPFTKYHGLGNDYLVIDGRSGMAGDVTPDFARRVCDRSFGVGSDGILLRGENPAPGAFAMRILNPDGSEAEKSGNGLRIFARHLREEGDVGPDAFQVSTPGGGVTCRVLSGGREVEVAMGRVSFDSREIPVQGPPREVLRERLVVDDHTLEFSAATLGNPHCVLIRDVVSEA